MITFLTLFLGLFTGPQQVAFDVADGVAAVELWLDGERIGRRDEAPWVFDCDFGELAVHELTAVALDETGQTLERQRRWVNLARPSFDAALRLLGPASNPQAVAVSWESLGRSEAPEVEVWFDGQPLPVDDLERIDLPEYDPRILHVVNAVIRFGETSRQLETRFGGEQGLQLEIELTSLAIEVDRPKRTVSKESLAGQILRDGQPLRVVGVEKDDVEILVVRDPNAQPFLEELARKVAPPPLVGEVVDRRREGAGQSPGLEWVRIRGKTLFRLDGHLRFVSTRPAPLVSDESQLFPLSDSLSTSGGGLYWLLGQADQVIWPRRAAEAVALAGMQAHALHRRRAIVLILAEPDRDASRFSIPEVRRYLERLGVPLLVWAIRPGIGEAWGDVRVLETPRDFERGLEDLRRRVQVQRIVWVEGRHRPQDLTYSGLQR